MSMKLDQLADRLVQAVAPDDDVRTSQRMRGVVRVDGTVDPDKVPVIYPWQSRDFYLPGVALMGANRGGILQFPQGGTIRMIAARCRTAPTGGPAEFALTVNGASAANALRVSIPAGGYAADSTAGHQLNPMSNLALIVVSANGAADVTITVHYEPSGVTNG